jgi:2-iminobutanoate/2-iminopropanoate deaminase
MVTERGRHAAVCEVIETSGAPAAVGPYSAGIRVSAGTGLVFVSGQLPLDPVSGQMVDGDLGSLVRQALANGVAVAEAAGSSKGQIVKATVFLTDLSRSASVNEAYAEFFGEWQPARSVVEVSGLPRNSPVEIEMIGVLGDAPRPS